MKRIIPIILISLLLFSSCAGNTIIGESQSDNSDAPYSDLNNGSTSSENGNTDDSNKNEENKESDSNKESDKVTDSENSETSAIPSTHIGFTDDNGKAKYTVVYPDSSHQILVDASQSLVASLKSATNTSFKSSTDKTTSDTSGEILIGNTKRTPQSFISSLGEREYIIKAGGSNIVIAGGSDYATAIAVSEFQKLYSNEKPYIKKSLNVKGTADTEYRVALTNSKDATIDIYSLLPFAKAPVLERRIKATKGSTGINFRDDKTYGKVIVAATGTYAEVLSYDTGKKLWYTESAASNAHGAELLPNGIVAVASSSGNEIRLFDMSGTRTKYKSISFTDAHAVLWDPEREVLWGVGKTYLKSFKVTKTAKDTIKVTEVTSAKVPCQPDLYAWGHDIAPIYGDTDKLWIAETRGLYIYSKSKNTFTDTVSGDNGVMHKTKIKGIGSFADGSIATSYPDGLTTSYQTWTTEKINLYFNYNGKLYHTVFNTPNMHHYKCRVVNFNYQ